VQIQEYTKIIATKIDKAIVTFDIESTGIDTSKDEIVQFAAVRIEPNGKVKQLTFLCKPSLPIAKAAAEVHGISDDDVKEAPEFKKFVPDIVKLFKGADVAGFNLASFDVKMLERQMTEHGYPEFFKDVHVYDAYKIFIQHCTRKLGDAVRFYVGQEIEDAHDALADVNSTIAVMAKQMEVENARFVDVAIKSTGKPEDRFALGKYIVFNDKKEPVLNFSKHKGKRLKDIDQGFVQWVLKQDFPKNLKDFLKKNA
jgi:DNA polymerase-3 subunit epsilon